MPRPPTPSCATLVSAAGRVADHSSLRPWRLIELRGDDRERSAARSTRRRATRASSSKPLRAPLLIAVVASYRKSEKVPRWEQEAVASGVAHVLSLLLDEAGWGVIWRTGPLHALKAVAKAHGLDEERGAARLALRRRQAAARRASDAGRASTRAITCRGCRSQGGLLSASRRRQPVTRGVVAATARHGDRRPTRAPPRPSPTSCSEPGLAGGGQSASSAIDVEQLADDRRPARAAARRCAATSAADRKM